MVANRLTTILSAVIDDSQGALILGRLITNNFIVAFELFHALKCRNQGKQGFMAVKTDMSNAYDHVEQSFFGIDNAEALVCRLLGI